MAVISGISGIPDMARVWSPAPPEKVALIDTDRVVTYAELEFFDKVDRGRAGATTSAL